MLRARGRLEGPLVLLNVTHRIVTHVGSFGVAVSAVDCTRLRLLRFFAKRGVCTLVSARPRAEPLITSPAGGVSLCDRTYSSYACPTKDNSNRNSYVRFTDLSSQEKRRAAARARATSTGCITPPTLYVLNVRRCDRCTRKPLRTRNTSSPLPGRCFLPHGARGHLCISGSTHALAPTPPFVSLTTMVFFA